MASSRQHTTSTLAYDTLQGFSCNKSLENSDKDTRHFFYPTAGAIKHVDYSSKEVCTLCNRYLGVCYVLRHLSNCIPVGHGLYKQFTGPFPCL